MVREYICHSTTDLITVSIQMMMRNKLVRVCFYIGISAAIVFLISNTASSSCNNSREIVLIPSSTSTTTAIIDDTHDEAVPVNNQKNWREQQLEERKDDAGPIITTPSSQQQQRRFAVFSCATPNRNSHRGFDYAFYLPLTVVAWRRIGFESLVLIVGDKIEWQNDPILSYVLDNLEHLQPDVTILFMAAKSVNRMMLSQTARIFVANMEGFPGRPSDFIMTTDADLWPLRKEHYYLPEGNIDSRLMLLHSDCCRPFKFGGRSYKMQPMSHVGASVATWREIFNRDSANINQSSIAIAKDSESILNYFQEIFGEKVRDRILFASGHWFLDQKLLTLRIDEWFNRQNSSSQEHCVYQVSDDGFERLHRMDWNEQDLTASSFRRFYDAHLPVTGFKPAKWKTITPLLHLMYDKDSALYEFCDHYAMGFNELLIMF